MNTFAEANAKLREFWPNTLPRQTYTLDYIVQLLNFVGNPQEKLKVIHVTGTSGKTSTCYYAAALLKAAGKQVGLTVSPHVDEINERVQINLVPLPEAEFCQELGIFLELVEKSGITPTYFELLVAFAFWEFARRGMEYAVMEVGMGGLLDGTNVVRREDKVCVITDVGLDHINVLGSTISEIAAQKAGIIQLHNSVFCYRQDEAVLGAIRARAKQKQADLHVLDAEDAAAELADLPLFQQRNVGLARAAVRHALAKNAGKLTPAMVSAASSTLIPARMETRHYRGKTLIIDGAHNAQKLHALGESLRHKYPREPIAALVSFADGRSYRLEDSTQELARLADHIIVTTFSGGQDERHASVDGVELAEIFERHGVHSLVIVPEPAAALKALLARPEPVLLVAGSFYLLNHIRPLLDETW